MAILSGGELVLSDAGSAFTYRSNYLANAGIELTGAQFASYGEIYRRQLWVAVLVRKRAISTRRLPLKVYRRAAEGREDATDTPYARLLARPNRQHSGAFLWEWTSSTLDIYGEAFWLKIRGRDGIPAELWPIHPSNITVERVPGSSDLVFLYSGGLLGGDPQYAIPQRDVVQFKDFNPNSTVRGMSKLEPLRATLVNEDAARRATASFWKNGARPGVLLTHPKTLSQPVIDRLRAQWDSLHAGADNTGGSAVLEEGMEPKIIPLNLEEAQYIETRRLNREEACAIYDVPPPVVHILDRATFSNITEQMRSMYRDTMAPHLGGLEETLEHWLRPDFGDDSLYAEFLMDEVLRGDFEVRAGAYQQAINSGWLTPAEVRQMENREAVEGADRLFINSTLIPIDEVSSRTSAAEPAVTPPALEGDTVPTAPTVLRSVMSYLGRLSSIDDIDVAKLTKGLSGHTGLIVKALEEATDANDDLDAFRSRLRRVLEESHA